MTILIIALGVWFIRGPKKAKGEDIPAFTPPAAEPEAREPQTEAGGQGPQEEAPHGDE